MDHEFFHFNIAIAHPSFFLVIVVIFLLLLLSKERSLHPCACQNLFGTFRLYRKGMKPNVMNLSQVSENSHFLSKYSFLN